MTIVFLDFKDNIEQKGHIKKPENSQNIPIHYDLIEKIKYTNYMNGSLQQYLNMNCLLYEVKLQRKTKQKPLFTRSD